MQDQKILRTAESGIPPKYTKFLYVEILRVDTHTQLNVVFYIIISQLLKSIPFLIFSSV
jgi:hypothetical protein